MAFLSFPAGAVPFYRCVQRTGRAREVLALIKQFTAGRLVTEARLITALRGQGVWPGEIAEALDLGVYRAELFQFPG